MDFKAVISATVDLAIERYEQRRKLNEWLPEREYLTPRQAEAYTGFDITTFERWRAAGDGPKYAVIGRAIRYSRRELDAWMEAHQVTQKGGAS